MGRDNITPRWVGHTKKGLVEDCLKVRLSWFRPWDALREFPAVMGSFTLVERHPWKGPGPERRLEYWMDAKKVIVLGPLVDISLRERHELTLSMERDALGRCCWWFKCPKCAHRARILYAMRGGVFIMGEGFSIACRTCQALTYRSTQQENGQTRTRDRRQCLQALRSRFGRGSE